jgi:L,D-transpeptidase YcbB
MRRLTTAASLALALAAALPASIAFSQESRQDAPGSVATADPSATPQAGADDPGTDASGAAAPSPASEPAAETQHHPIAVESAPAKPDVQSPALAADQDAAAATAVFPIGAGVRELLPKVRDGAEASEEAKAVSAAYAARRDEAIWVTPTGLSAKGASAVAEIKKAGDWGLEASDYVLPSLPDGTAATVELPRAELADAELKIAFAVLAYGRDARGGRIMDPSKQLSSYLDRAPQLVEPSILLTELAESDDPGELLRKLHPQHAQFEKLRQKYLELRTKAAGVREIVRLPDSGPKLVPGIKHREVGLLRERLGVSVASAGGVSADETEYDAALVEAVKAFQEKNGQKPDGIVGRNTRAALNDFDAPDPQRLLANMEQWRWMPADMGDVYINVNIPEFMVRVVDHGNVVLEERVVTGQTDKQTPVFSDQLETIFFHPRWNVPESIKVLELYPSLARGGGSFQRQGLKMMRNGREVSASSVDWGQADIRNFDVYQPSGPGNVLGDVKFVFPNKHGVYLHDTSAKALFNEPSRTFSHGCMRVQNPLRLAETLLTLDKGWPADRVTEILDREPDETPVQIDKKIPVHVTYFTIVIGDDGQEHIFKDVYGHEQRIKLALAGKFDQIAVGADHLAPVEFKRVQYAQSPDDFGSFFGFGSGQSGTSSSSGSGGGTQAATSLSDFFNDVFGGPAPPVKKQKRRNGQVSKNP